MKAPENPGENDIFANLLKNIQGSGSPPSKGPQTPPPVDPSRYPDFSTFGIEEIEGDNFITSREPGATPQYLLSDVLGKMGYSRKNPAPYVAVLGTSTSYMKREYPIRPSMPLSRGQRPETTTLKDFDSIPLVIPMDSVAGDPPIHSSMLVSSRDHSSAAEIANNIAWQLTPQNRSNVGLMRLPWFLQPSIKLLEVTSDVEVVESLEHSLRNVLSHNTIYIFYLHGKYRTIPGMRNFTTYVNEKGSTLLADANSIASQPDIDRVKEEAYVYKPVSLG